MRPRPLEAQGRQSIDPPVNLGYPHFQRIKAFKRRYVAPTQSLDNLNR
jgi:hypothetical protein